ncbi:MAG: hypothetical protein J5702_06110 [Bacteroidales bacterium]|nr:hypothetical protein [Bacteroidales bacterium]
MARSFFRGLRPLILIPVLAGCTVLEDRMPCPCYLDVDYRQVRAGDLAEMPGGLVDVKLFAPDPAWGERHPIDACPDLEEVTVDKARIRVVGLVHDRPLRGYLDEGTRIAYEPGNQIDSLYVHTEEVDCTGEEARTVIRPHKQFSTLFITDEENGDICRQYHLVVRGTTCGFDAADCTALEGPYWYTVQEYDRSGRISVRIPRQLRSDLVLEFWDKESRRKLFSSPLGLRMFDAGYDPSAADLPDYEFRIDFRRALLFLRIPDWEEVRVYGLYE